MSEILSRYTQYEMILITVFILLVLISFGVATYFLTKDKRAVRTVLGSLLSSFILTSLILLISKTLFNIILSDRYMLLALVSLLIVSINTSILIGEYSAQLKRKDFDIDHVTRAHFSSTLNSTIIVFLSILSFMIVVQTDLKIMFGIFLTPTILSIWITHFLSRKLLVDEQ